jgi:hypothetical protein
VIQEISPDRDHLLKPKQTGLDFVFLFLFLNTKAIEIKKKSLPLKFPASTQEDWVDFSVGRSQWLF